MLQPLSPFLAAHPKILTFFASFSLFLVYTTVYGFRKPYQAEKYTGLEFAGILDFKTATVISQLCGYAISKFLGVKIVSEIPRTGPKRIFFLIAMICISEFGLVLFALLPLNAKILGTFVNALPLGMIWGILVTFVEGRATTDFILALGSSSFVVASGITKDAALIIKSKLSLNPFHMPVITGLFFLPLYLFGLFLLWQIPPPSLQEAKTRRARVAMDSSMRKKFFKDYWMGIVPLIMASILSAAYRDYRYANSFPMQFSDAFLVEIFSALDVPLESGVMSKSELLVGLIVVIAASLIVFIKSNRLGFNFNMGLMTLGFITLGLSIFFLDSLKIPAFFFVCLTGVSVSIIVVPAGAGLYDRMIAFLHIENATAAFPMQLTGAFGVVGSAAVFFIKAFFKKMDHLSFFRIFSYLSSAFGGGCMLLAFAYLVYYKPRQTRLVEDEIDEVKVDELVDVKGGKQEKFGV